MDREQTPVLFLHIPPCLLQLPFLDGHAYRLEHLERLLLLTFSLALGGLKAFVRCSRWIYADDVFQFEKKSD
jgi:hypothetical protein